MDLVNLYNNSKLICELIDIVDLARDRKQRIVREKTTHKPKGYKRRNAHVTEMFFENVVLPKISQGSTSTGWIRFFERNAENRVCWIKVCFSWTNNKAKEVDKAFILSQLNSEIKPRFFLLGIGKEYQFVTRELVSNTLEPSSYKFVKLNCYSLIDVQKMNSKLSSLLLELENAHFVMNELGDEIGFSFAWLAGMPNEKLFGLLCNRILMNFGLKNPSDLDAIELGHSGKLTIHEFKRKSSFKNRAYVFQSTHETASAEAREIVKAADQHLKNKQMLVGGKLKVPKEEATSAIDSFLLEKKMNYKYLILKKYGLFGLDTSHVATIEMCMEKQYQYVQSIWKTEKGKDIDTLFDKGKALHLKPQLNTHNSKVYSKSLTSSDLVGFTTTVGRDSGSWSEGTRVQFVFKEELMLSETYIELANLKYATG